jgi:dihydroneopterin aldolase
MTIHIDALQFDVIIGLLDFEREVPQRVVIDVQATYSYNNEEFINYADMALLIQNELKDKCYELLEEALLGLKNILFTTYPQIKKLQIKIAKPDILSNCSVALSNSWEF